MSRSIAATRAITRDLTPALKADPEQRGDTRVWRWAASRTWYEHPAQTDAYNSLRNYPQYNAGMFDAEKQCFELNKQRIIELLPAEFIIVDLGCGDAGKSIRLMKVAAASDKRSMLCPVDISDVMLKEAMQNARRARVRVTGPIKADFEIELDKIVAEVSEKIPALYTIYATICNFDIDALLSKFQRTLKKKDMILFSTQLYGDDVAYIERQYEEEPVKRMATEVMRSLGFEKTDINFGVRFNSARMEIEVYFIVNRVPDAIAKKYGVWSGDEIVVLYSCKPRLLELEEIAERHLEDGEIFTNKAETFATIIGKLRK